MRQFYKDFDAIKEDYFDGMIVTGAPVEADALRGGQLLGRDHRHLRLGTHPRYLYLIYMLGCPGEPLPFLWHPKYSLPAKMFGVFRHTLREPFLPIFRGFDDEFYVPHSRHTEVRREDILKVPELTLLSESEESGVYMAMARGGREFFITGHSEYSPYTLNDEYVRDLNKGLPIAVPRNYYRNDDPSLGPVVRWRGHANLLLRTG